MKEKKEVQFTISFIDKYTHEYLGNDPAEVASKLSLQRQAEFKALVYTAETGIIHKPSIK